MNPTLITGTIIVTCALTCYSIAVLSQQRRKTLSSFIMAFLTIGLLLDITATVFMIRGSRNMPFTAHGLLGYSALLAMLVDTFLTWRHWRAESGSGPIPAGLFRYTRIAYGWWVVAYFAGAIIAMVSV